MTEQEITLAGATLKARGSGALWWPAERLLCISDLHLGKSERLARHGGPLFPPYETQATLDRVCDEIARLSPALVVCLGDSFDDEASAANLAEADARRLTELMVGRDWVWIGGNHDPGPIALGGRHLVELRLGALVFRHAAVGTSPPGEISGHYHPKMRLPARGRTLTRPCFLHDARRLILPAFGVYTGGLWADSPMLSVLFTPPVRAVLTGIPCLGVPLAPRRPSERSSGFLA